MVVKKENKYVVLKIDDIGHLSIRQRRHLDSILEQIKVIRRRQGRPTDNKYIICNQDEPYSEKVWQSILDGEREKEKAKAAPAPDCDTCAGQGSDCSNYCVAGDHYQPRDQVPPAPPAPPGQ